MRTIILTALIACTGTTGETDTTTTDDTDQSATDDTGDTADTNDPGVLTGRFAWTYGVRDEYAMDTDEWDRELGVWPLDAQVQLCCEASFYRILTVQGGNYLGEDEDGTWMWEWVTQGAGVDVTRREDGRLWAAERGYEPRLPPHVRMLVEISDTADVEGPGYEFDTIEIKEVLCADVPEGVTHYEDLGLGGIAVHRVTLRTDGSLTESAVWGGEEWLSAGSNRPSNDLHCHDEGIVSQTFKVVPDAPQYTETP